MFIFQKMITTIKYYFVFLMLKKLWNTKAKNFIINRFIIKKINHSFLLKTNQKKKFKYLQIESKIIDYDEFVYKLNSLIKKTIDN